MNTHFPLTASALLTILAAHGQSTIAPAQPFVWSANAGWLNARPSTADGVRTGDTVCSGYAWGANIGWIHFGDGSPSNGIRYNNGAGDWGVNVMPDGKLRGYAWGQNVGWINFESTGDPRVDLGSGQLSGYAWGANIGWIYLATAQTTRLAILDSDNDGISDAWEKERANGNLATLGHPGDADGDGQSDLMEFEADTDPLDPGALLRIVSFSQSNGGLSVNLAFTSTVSRRYQVSDSTDMTTGSWNDVGLGLLSGQPGSTSVGFGGPTVSRRFYRVSATRPLAGP